MMNTHSVCMALSLGRGEDKEMGLDLSGEDLLGSLMVEVNDKRKRLTADKSCNCLLGDLK